MIDQKIIKTDVPNCGDPFIIIENGFYYMFGTVKGEPFIAYKSSDGVHYESIGQVMHKDDSFGVKDFWAPEVIKYNNKFYMFYSARDKDDTLKVSVAISHKIEGPYKDINKNEALLNYLGYATIDASPFIDKDGRIYLFFVRECSQQIVNGVHTSDTYVVELDKTMSKTIGKVIFLSTPTEKWERYDNDDYVWNEGPSVLLYNDKYYLTYSCHHFRDPNYCVGLSISDCVTGPYKKVKEGPILKSIEGIIHGPGHSSFLKDKDGEIYIVYHVHKDLKIENGRTACLSKVHFVDGKLIINYR